MNINMMTTKTKSVLSVFVMIHCLAPGLVRAAERSEILRGFRSADGHVLVEMAAGNFPSGNVFFLGDQKKLSQLELTWDDSSTDERVLIYIGGENQDSSEITLSRTEASVENGIRPGHPHVDQMKAMSAAELKGISHASVELLPATWKSKYLFQSAMSGEYILVKEPTFNFHGNYRVWIGDLKEMKELPVKTSENWKDSVAGNIAFASGGGLFIPKMSEILSTLRPTQAEMPTLVRANSSTFEVLKVPKLSPVHLARLGFVREHGGNPNDVLSAQR